MKTNKRGWRVVVMAFVCMGFFYQGDAWLWFIRSLALAAFGWMSYAVMSDKS